MASDKKIFIVGFPYVRESYFATFSCYPNGDQLTFLLPNIWKIKKGEVVFHSPKDPRIHTARAFFSHSHYPIIGGLLKGLMPAFPLVLWRVRHRADLIYACSEPNLLTTMYYALWAKMFRKKLVLFSWENIPYEKKFFGLNLLVKRIIIWINLALSDGIICGSTKGRDIFQKLTQNPIAVIPMSGVNTELFQRRGTGKKFNEYDWREKIVFTFAGAIGYRKGIHNIIKAFDYIASELSLVHLVIVGSGEYGREIDTMVRTVRAADKITRIPWLDYSKLPALLEASDVFLYPSISHGGWEEQFGYSMAEASLMELPVVSTRSGSIEDVVVDGKTGILVEPDNVIQLANAMVRLAMDSALRMRLGHEGRKYITRHFSHAVVAQQFFEFFNRVNGIRPH